MKKYSVAVLAFLLIGAVVLSACTSQPPPAPATSAPLPASEAAPPSSKVAPKPYQADAKFISDYNTLWSLLENDYPFWGVAQRETGKDFAEVKERYRAILETPHFVNTAEQFFTKIVQPCLWEFNGAGHLTAIDKAEYERRYARAQNSLDVTMGNHERFLNEQYQLPHVRAFYDSLPDPIAPMSMSVPMAATPQATQTASPNLSFQYYPETSTAYMSILKMTGFEDNDDSHLLQEFFEKISREGYKHCIIDIRQNGGGSTGYWNANIVKPNLKESHTYSNYGLIKSDRCREYVELFGAPVHPIDKLEAGKLPNLHPEDYKSAKYYWDRTVITGQTWGRDENQPFDPVFEGDFWLLVGPRVYSASEAFALFCKETGFAKLVGTTTGGDGVGIAPMVVPLPETGICIQFSAMDGLNADGSSNEEFGTQPDIATAPDEDALARCLAEIAQLQAQD